MSISIKGTIGFLNVIFCFRSLFNSNMGSEITRKVVEVRFEVGSMFVILLVSNVNICSVIVNVVVLFSFSHFCILEKYPVDSYIVLNCFKSYLKFPKMNIVPLVKSTIEMGLYWESTTYLKNSSSLRSFRSFTKRHCGSL